MHIKISMSYSVSPSPCSPCTPSTLITWDIIDFSMAYKAPLRDVPRGVAQERIDINAACDIVSCAYGTVLPRYEISMFLLYILTCTPLIDPLELDLLFRGWDTHGKGVELHWLYRFIDFVDHSAKHGIIFARLLMYVVVALTTNKVSPAQKRGLPTKKLWKYSTRDTRHTCVTHWIEQHS